MSTTTSIEWTDVTWNPVRGCSLVSAGCQNCYAMKQAHRFSGKGKPYDGLTEIGPNGPRWNGNVRLVPEALEEPLHWKKPRRVFVNSMSDLFHEDVPDEFIADVWARMCVADHHTYQILTKRPKRMLEWLTSTDWERVARFVAKTSPMAAHRALQRKRAGFKMFEHVWLGVSVEDQVTADTRIPILLQTPAAVRWISAEPLLGKVDIWRHVAGICDGGCLSSAATCDHYHRSGKIACCPDCRHRSIDWVVIGGESGHGARPCDLAWIRSIKDQCQAESVPVFCKQLGARWYDMRARIGIKGSCVVPVDSRPWMWVTQQDRKGGDMTDPEFPEDLKVRDYPR